LTKLIGDANDDFIAVYARIKRLTVSIIFYNLINYKFEPQATAKRSKQARPHNIIFTYRWFPCRWGTCSRRRALLRSRSCWPAPRCTPL